MRQFRLGIPWLSVAGLLLLGFVVALTVSVRWGGVIMAIALFTGAAWRAFVPERFVLDLKVRSRVVDIAMYSIFGFLVLLVFGAAQLS